MKDFHVTKVVACVIFNYLQHISYTLILIILKSHPDN